MADPVAGVVDQVCDGLFECGFGGMKGFERGEDVVEKGIVIATAGFENKFSW